MPNYIWNEITFTGEKQDIASVLTAIKSDDSEFDFNKLIPMPEELNLPSGPDTSRAILVYLMNNFKTRLTDEIAVTYLVYTNAVIMWEAKRKRYFDAKDFQITLKLMEYVKERVKINAVYKEIARKKEEIYAAGLYSARPFGDCNTTYYDMGKRYVDNIKRYGHPTWYEWCKENWGVKWNPTEAEIYGDNLLRFSTANVCPTQILNALSKLCIKNNVGFHGVSSSETAGYEAYRYSLEDEIYTLIMLTDYSSDAYDVYEEIFGSLDDDTCYGRDEYGIPFHYDCKTCPNKCV